MRVPPDGRQRVSHSGASLGQRRWELDILGHSKLFLSHRAQPPKKLFENMRDFLDKRCNGNI